MPRRKRRLRKTPQPKSQLPAPSFVLRYAEPEIHETALKHGVSTLDIHHACAQEFAAFEIDQGSFETKILIVGPDSAGNFLEVIGLEIDNKPLLIIHAMKLRKSMIRLIEGLS
ncbi:MAG: hypothetical protein ACKOBB_13580 [Acidimicrobiaceae bacterium]